MELRSVLNWAINVVVSLSCFHTAWISLKARWMARTDYFCKFQGNNYNVNKEEQVNEEQKNSITHVIHEWVHGNCFDAVYNRRKMCCFSQLRTAVDISFLVVVTTAPIAVIPGGNYLHTPMLFRRGNEGKCQCSIPRGEKLGHIASVVR